MLGKPHPDWYNEIVWGFAGGCVTGVGPYHTGGQWSVRMTIFDVINLAGGIGLFLYGMSIMGAGLEKIAGGRMEKVLQKLTCSVWRAVLLGAIITGLIQSSAGTTVICIGLVNAGIFQLSQAIGVIMGANIGTTVTGQLIRLADISGDNLLLTMINPKTFSPLVALAGAILFVFFKSPKKRTIGQVLMGFGILFTGMFTMENAVYPLRESELFLELFSKLQNPLLGVLAGALVTVAIQSSSASVGILQALSATGAVTWGSAIPIILGQNIGTCSTPLIASMGASTAAKRSAVVHLYFNIIGTVVFLLGIYGLRAAGLFPFWYDVMNKGDIANFHTLFNVVVTLMFMPFTRVLAWLAERTIPDKPGGEPDLTMPVLDERLFTSPAVALQQARNAVTKMGTRAARNVQLALPMLEKYDEETADQIDQRESLIDKMEVGVSNYLVRISEHELSEDENQQVNELISFITDFERIGDYAINVRERAEEMRDKELSFSQAAYAEMAVLSDAIQEILELTNEAFGEPGSQSLDRVEPLEETIDLLCATMRRRHVDRLRDGACQLESGIIFLDVLTDLERISDHCSNIAARLVGLRRNETLDAHALRRELHTGVLPGYSESMARYREKYCERMGTELTA